MKRTLLLASGLSALTLGVHVFAGEPEVNQVVQASDLAPELRAILGVIWHAVTVVLLVSAIGFGTAARRPNRPLEATLVAIMLGWAGLFIYYGITALGTLAPMPQWIIFLAIPAIVLFGWRRRA